MPVLDLDQPAHRDPLKVLLRLLEDEGRAWHGEALDDARQRHGALRRQRQIVRRAHGKVGHVLEIAHRVGAQLQIADGDLVFGNAPQRPEKDGLDGARQTRGFEGGLGGVWEGSLVALKC